MVSVDDYDEVRIWELIPLNVLGGRLWVNFELWELVLEARLFPYLLGGSANCGVELCSCNR
jgi:hypothetical protein